MAVKELGAHSSCHSTLAKHPVKDCCKHPKIKISLNADQLITHPDAYKFFPLVASSSHQEVLKPIIYRLSEVATICQSPPLYYSKAIERLARFSVFLI
ncbi:MAG: hypothetical protein IRZ29_01230 [Thermoflavifilum sp.]|nr:hypothetical protein [Thermoflavifilum sp.]